MVFLKRGVELTIFKENVKKSFKKIKEEMEDHLQAINENTTEINNLSSEIKDINERIEKIQAKLNDIFTFMSDYFHFKSLPSEIKPLTNIEKRIFFILYTAENPISLTELSKRLELPLFKIEEIINILKEKGIPIICFNLNGKTYLQLEEYFKTLQAKHNVIQMKLDTF